MDWCQACSKDVACAVTMNGAAQFVKSCPDCGERVGQALSKPMADYDKATERPLAVAPPRPSADVLMLPVANRGRSAAAQTSATEPPDVMATVRDRLSYLEAEIAKRAGYEVEAKMLRKMLDVAERPASPKRTPVKPMPRILG